MPKAAFNVSRPNLCVPAVSCPLWLASLKADMLFHGDVEIMNSRSIVSSFVLSRAREL